MAKCNQLTPALERVNCLLVVAVRCSVSLPDDNTQSFLRALKDNVRPGTTMVVVILPSNRKDRYDAIKTYCCVENPGMQLGAYHITD